MKMMRSTSITSIMGVTLGSAFTPPPLLTLIPIAQLLALSRPIWRPVRSADRMTDRDYCEIDC
jgi:hypothetical protein